MASRLLRKRGHEVGGIPSWSEQLRILAPIGLFLVPACCGRYYALTRRSCLRILVFLFNALGLVSLWVGSEKWKDQSPLQTMPVCAAAVLASSPRGGSTNALQQKLTHRLALAASPRPIREGNTGSRSTLV